MIVVPVPAHQVWAWAPVVLPELKRVDRWLGGRMTAEHLMHACAEDRMLLWVVHDFEDNFRAVLVTQVNVYPLAKVLSFVACAGADAKSWVPSVNVIIRQYAKKMGCTIWEIWARKGWKRVLAGLSPREFLVVLDGAV